MDKPEDTKMMAYAVPGEDDYTAVVGCIAIAHAHLDHGLRMMIRTLADLTITEAMNATEYDGSRSLRDQVRKLGRQRLGVGQPFLKLKDLLFRCEQITKKRNDLLHSIFAMDLDDGEIQIMSRELGWTDPPSYESLRNLYYDLRTLANEMNSVRLEGFLREALKENS